MQPLSNPSANMQELLQSNHVTPQTREVLEARLAHIAIREPRFFSPEIFATLKAVCARLIPQTTEGEAVDLPDLLDEELLDGVGKGWRYDSTPPDANMFPRGIEGIDQSAAVLFSAAFTDLEASRQDDVLQAVQTGNAPGVVWQRLPSGKFFEELLVALAELYYSHPIAKAQIGDASFADAQGWVRIGLGQQDAPLLQQPVNPPL